MNESVLNVYRALFAARTDVYSHWTSDGWRPVRAEMTPEIVGNALAKKGPSISGYMIAPGDVTHIAAYDLDLDNGLDLGRQLAQHLQSIGIRSFVEPSRRGCHLWLPLEEVTPAIQIRAAMCQWAVDAGMPEDPEGKSKVHPKIELRPATDRIGQDGLGHCIRMPLMPHPVTGKRGYLEHPDGTSLGKSLPDILLEAFTYTITPAQIADAAMRWVPLVTKVPPEYRSPRAPREDDDASASEILRTLWGVHDAQPGRVFSCPAKAYHSHGDIHKGFSILADDKRAICHKNGCILSNDLRGRGTWELRTMAAANA